MSAEFVKAFQERGFFHQCTDLDALEQLMQKQKITAYIGFDCTAPSLHVGSLMQIMILRLLQQFGHKPIVLIGGGTTKVGDPSGKDEARKILSDDEITANMNGIRKVLEKFLSFGEGSNDAILVNNNDWLANINYIDFLRNYGRFFSVNRMLSFDSVKLRLEREQNLSFLEFNYMLLQAYDFAELNRRYACRLQIGGSDQWGNIVNGIELNRKLAQAEVYGLTTPLLTTSSGTKMGKTASGAVWLSADMLSPYDYFQFWRNTDDADVIPFLRLFTDISIEEIEELSKLDGSGINEAKKILAYAATKLCHGGKEADASLETARVTFEEKNLGKRLPVTEISKAELEVGVTIAELLQRCKLSASGGEAKRLIRGKGARVNDNVVDNERTIITIEDAIDGNIKLSAGKKNHAVIKVG